MGHPVWGARAPDLGGRDIFSHFGNSSEVSTEAELRLAYNPAIPLLVLQPMHPYFQRETPTRILTVALFIIAPATQLPLIVRMEKQTVGSHNEILHSNEKELPGTALNSVEEAHKCDVRRGKLDTQAPLAATPFI